MEAQPAAVQAARLAGATGVGHVLDGLTLVQDVNAQYRLTLDESEARTLGGLLFFSLGRAPHLGDSVELDGARLTVAEVDGLRVAAVRLEVIGGRHV